MSLTDITGDPQEDWGKDDAQYDDPDPNADLFGFEWEQEDGSIGTVTGPCDWSDQYVSCALTYEKNGSRHVMRGVLKPAAVVRRRKELDSERE